MRMRFVLPIGIAVVITAFAGLVSYWVTVDYGAYTAGPVAYFCGGLVVCWPFVVVVGAVCAGVPYRSGERMAAMVAGASMMVVAVLSIGIGSVWGTRERAALLPTSPACVAHADASAEEIAFARDVDGALGAIDHPVRFDASSAEVTDDYCQNAVDIGSMSDGWVERYEAVLAQGGWQVDDAVTSRFAILTATRGQFRIRIFVDDPGRRGLTVLRIERR